MGVEVDLRTALNTDIPEVSGRIYPLIMPQDTVANSIVYRVLAESDENCMEGEVFDTRKHMQVDVWANTYAECIDLADKVKTSLYDNFDISGLFVVDIYEDYTMRYRRVVDFRIL